MTEYNSKPISYLAKVRADEILLQFAKICDRPTKLNSLDLLDQVREFKTAGLMDYLREDYNLFYNMLSDIEESILENLHKYGKN